RRRAAHRVARGRPRRHDRPRRRGLRGRAAVSHHHHGPDPGSLADAPVRDDDANGVRIVTFGCRLNAYESEVIRKRAAEDGLADAVVFNTCAVTGEAVRQARQAIRKARRERPGAELIVTRWDGPRDPASCAAMAEVALVLGKAEKSAPGAYLPTPEPMRVRVNDIMSVRETAGHL